MFKTITATELRGQLSSILKNLEDGPVIVMSRSRQSAVLVEPEAFELLLERCEDFEDLVEGRRAVSEYLNDKSIAVDSEEVFERLGL